MTAKTPPPEEELARLRAQVQQLEAEVARKEHELADRAERSAEDLRRDADRRYRPSDPRGNREDRDRGARAAQGARDDRYRGGKADRSRDADRRYDASRSYDDRGYDRDSNRDERTDARQETRRVANDMSATTWRKSEIATRAFRGATLASLDAIRLFADSLSWLADGALRRNRADDRNTSVDELSRRLPSDLTASFADAVDDWVDIPARAASRFADSYFEGEYRRNRDSDSEPPRDDDRRYDRDRSRDDDRRDRSGTEEESGVHVEFRASRTADERPAPPPASPKL
jgi:hypothetical protein